MMRKTIVALAVGALAAGCSTKRVHEEPIMENGDRVSVPDGTEAQGTGTAAETRERRDEIRADALAECSPEACEAIVRGEVALGLTRRGVMAATGTTEDAWSVRGTGGSSVLTPASLTRPPRDAVSELAMVRLEDGRVTSFAYREAEGMRLVREPGDASPEGRAAARARALVREGDELAAVGRLDAALDRYDRADVLDPGDPMIDYRIATVLDKQLRPIQALIQYRLFLHQLELERIEARGEVAARIAEAIARARDRVIVLERQTR